MCSELEATNGQGWIHAKRKSVTAASIRLSWFACCSRDGYNALTYQLQEALLLRFGSVHASQNWEIQNKHD